MATETETKTLAELVAIAEGSLNDPDWNPVADLLAERLRELGRANARTNRADTTKHGRVKTVLLRDTGDDKRSRGGYERTPPVLLPDD